MTIEASTLLLFLLEGGLWGRDLGWGWVLFPTEPAVFSFVFIFCLLLMVGSRMLVLIADCICWWKLNVVGYRLSSADCRLLVVRSLVVWCRLSGVECLCRLSLRFSTVCGVSEVFRKNKKGVCYHPR